MARSEHLPIYKQSYDLCLYLEQVVQGFPRYHKYSIGSDLRDTAREILKLIVRANARDDKREVLQNIREEVEQLKLLLRLALDVHAFSRLNSFEHAVTIAVDVAKQNEGWLKSQHQSRGQNRKAMPPG